MYAYYTYCITGGGPGRVVCTFMVFFVLRSCNHITLRKVLTEVNNQVLKQASKLKAVCRQRHYNIELEPNRSVLIQNVERRSHEYLATGTELDLFASLKPKHLNKYSLEPLYTKEFIKEFIQALIKAWHFTCHAE